MKCASMLSSRRTSLAVSPQWVFTRHHRGIAGISSNSTPIGSMCHQVAWPVIFNNVSQGNRLTHQRVYYPVYPGRWPRHWCRWILGLLLKPNGHFAGFKRWHKACSSSYQGNIHHTLQNVILLATHLKLGSSIPCVHERLFLYLVDPSID